MREEITNLLFAAVVENVEAAAAGVLCGKTRAGEASSCIAAALRKQVEDFLVGDAAGVYRAVLDAAARITGRGREASWDADAHLPLMSMFNVLQEPEKNFAYEAVPLSEELNVPVDAASYR